MTMRKFTKNEKGGAGVVALLLVILILAVGTAVLVVADNGSIGKSTSMEAVKITTEDSSKKDESSSEAEAEPLPEPEPEPVSLLPVKSADYKEVNGKKIDSKYCILVDADTNEIIAGTGYDTKMYPASLTKLMTLLVAVENADDLKATYKFSNDVIDPLIEQDASRVGFEAGEKATVKDMLYGTILVSGADCTVGLSNLISGSEKEFAELMNRRAEELGLESTHFVNSSGLHNKNHISSCLDMAAIMKACLDNKTCKKIISTETYTTAKTKQHENGIELNSFAFKNIYEFGKDPDFEIGGGKTGYTDEAGTLLASYLEYEGKTYIAITAKALTQDQAVLDTEYLYHTYVVAPAKKAAESKDESTESEEKTAEEKTDDSSKEEKAA